jgi:hypothetical protein
VSERLNRELRGYRTIGAAVKGWKVRRIMATSKEVINIKREMADITYDMRRALMMQSSQA